MSRPVSRSRSKENRYICDHNAREEKKKKREEKKKKL